MKLRTAVCPQCQRTVFEGAIEPAHGSILMDKHPSIGCATQVNKPGWRDEMSYLSWLCAGEGQQPEYVYPK